VGRDSCGGVSESHTSQKRNSLERGIPRKRHVHAVSGGEAAQCKIT
jgi:hypothetical protein